MEKTENFNRPKINQLETSRKSSYADTLKKPSQEMKNITKKSNVPAIIIKPKTKQSFKETKEEIQKKINPTAINVSVNNVREIKNGGIVIKLTNESGVEDFKKLSEEQLKGKYSVKVSKLNAPKLILIGSKTNYETENLINDLKRLNYIDNEDDLKITGLKKSKFSNKFLTYLETTGRTFTKLVNKEIGLGWDHCKFLEILDIKFCYKCCKYDD